MLIANRIAAQTTSCLEPNSCRRTAIFLLGSTKYCSYECLHCSISARCSVHLLHRKRKKGALLSESAPGMGGDSRGANNASSSEEPGIVGGAGAASTKCTGFLSIAISGRVGDTSCRPVHHQIRPCRIRRWTIRLLPAFCPKWVLACEEQVTLAGAIFAKGVALWVRMKRKTHPRIEFSRQQPWLKRMRGIQQGNCSRGLKKPLEPELAPAD